MKHIFSFVLTFLALSASAQAVDPAITQQNIQNTICIPGYSESVRPPLVVSNRIKYQLLRGHGLLRSDAPLYELDHIIPISLGGAPLDVFNMQIQLWEGPRGAHRKDILEAEYHWQVCNLQMTLSAAQLYFAHNWVIP